MINCNIVVKGVFAVSFYQVDDYTGIRGEGVRLKLGQSRCVYGKYKGDLCMVYTLKHIYESKI